MMFHPKGPTFMELAKQALSSTVEGYDLLAPKFEHTPFRTPDELIGPLVEAVGDDAGSVLDLACGTGALARAIAPHAARVVGIDISEGMLEEGRRLAGKEAVDVDFRKIDLFDMPFENEFDVIVTSGAFGHILQPDQTRFAAQVWRALRPGGRLVFISTYTPSKADPAYWAARGFNAAMHVRNALLSPPFVMFYLTFCIERASEILWKQGFQVKVEDPYRDTANRRAKLVIATRP